MELIDDHCHPFTLEAEPLDAARITLDVHEGAASEARRQASGPLRLSQELLTVRLAAFFGCPPEELGAAREAAARDWAGYVRRLLDDAQIGALVWDAGWTPGAEDAVEAHAAVAGRPLHPLFRIDPLIDRLITDGAGAQEIVHAVGERLAGAPARGEVGFKTVLAYRTGLAVDPAVTLEMAEQSLRDASLPVRRRGAACRALVLRHALAISAELGLPFQIHTGFGDSDLRLGEANPLLLEPLLRMPEGEASRVVLLHGSYPWHEEAAYLAATRANVWVDFSLVDLFAPATTAERLLRMLDLAPADRLLLGTDAHGLPETYWFAARVLREAWGQVRERLLALGARAAWIDQVEQRTFATNAAELYRLSPSTT